MKFIPENPADFQHPSVGDVVQMIDGLPERYRERVRQMCELAWQRGWLDGCSDVLANNAEIARHSNPDLPEATDNPLAAYSYI